MTLVEQLNEIVDVLYRMAFTGWLVVFILMVPAASLMPPAGFMAYLAAEYSLAIWILYDAKREKRMRRTNGA